MATIYPSLEDMAVDKMATVQTQFAQAITPQQALPAQPHQPPVHVYPSAPTGDRAPPSVVPGPYTLYPSLGEYMGINMSAPEVQKYVAQNQIVPATSHPVAKQGACTVVAPVSGTQNPDILRSEIKQGVREVIVCKGADGKVGISIKDINKGVFVAYVRNGSAGAMSGLRFGDQILQINSETVAGWTQDKFNKFIKAASGAKITLAIRDRPFERIITMQKDSQGHIGFAFKNGEIHQIIKDSSAARNGILTNHYLIEVNGQNVVGLKVSLFPFLRLNNEIRCDNLFLG
eukprot:TRINITY_DN1683_c0_g3_i2.p1 TRINITY_DN1683_c0_g3~~TRINITY_DN1683_c0_g3_i2.p1  ORF type:complete len:288 (+),score=50.53 TRINITY_DN1683_c0_g3_i2:166-1029(+)